MTAIRDYSIVLIAAVALAGCTSQDSPVQVHAPTESVDVQSSAAPAPAELASKADAPANTAPGASSNPRGSAASQWQHVEWVGRRHTEIMNQVASSRSEWRRENRVQQCRRVFAIVHRHALEIQREQRAFTGRDVRRLSLDAMRDQGGCDPRLPLSLWAVGSGANALLAQDYVYHPDHGEPVTGAYESYVAAIEAVPYNHSTKSSMKSAVNSIVSNASGIPDADLKVVLAAASLTLESIDFWYDYEASGGFDDGTRDPVLQMSIFRMQSGKTISGGIAHDALGCGGAVASAKILAGGGPIGWKILGGVCLVSGGAASAMYAI